MTQPTLPAALAAYAAPSGRPAPYELLADRDDGTVVRCGNSVAKAHAPDTDRDGLTVRMRIAGARALSQVLLQPLRTEVEHIQGRPVSLWPYGAPVDPHRPEDAPWEAMARLLAALHQVPLHRLPGPVPPMRGPAKLARALRRLAAAPDAATVAEARAVRAAARTLPGWARGETPAPAGGVLCHGDLHLGQLVRFPLAEAEGSWRLIDVDDLGAGTPAWDLARPAAWYAAGLVDADTWLRFLDAYRDAGGPGAGRPGSDPWPELDLAARALTVQTAALALAKAAGEGRRLEDVERLMVDACARIATLPPHLEPAPTS
ncbi:MULTISPECIES: phosphotransferase [unclassified Streptomyces]|uniref:phosphotransferase n=1 Tax=unclassified Streptomyces TaxID=2593676 RepID=UPI00225637B8|nr:MULTISPECIES: phosphotransferase [unclassified Streptomyces]MCX4524891.1 aminoglycoside phosphotransferase family protein [Streptomyces sp. NBC_01551]MCX4544598.1 aminoglycoside phosphotransferase family protein [Streptomyces sp. NBC_01565]